MINPSRTLLVLAAFAALPMAHALDINDDNVKLALSLRLQLRADASSAENSAGKNADIGPDATAGTAAAGDNDPVDFYLRRTRLGLKGSYKGDYKFSIVLSADKAETKDKAVVLNEAIATRVWKSETSGLTHELRVGLSNAWFNDENAPTSSSTFLFPGARATDVLLKSRGTGVGYQLYHPYGSFSVDVQNNITQTPGVKDGMFYSARLDLSPKGEFNIAKRTESFLGKAGKGVALGLDYGMNTRTANNVTTRGSGVDLLGHVDGLTAIAECRIDQQDTHAVSGAVTAVHKRVWLVQAGYAMPLGNAVIEPAVRYTDIDLNTKNNHEGTAFGRELDFGTSGQQIEAGVNYYISGHNNKIQLDYLNWTGEKGTTAATHKEPKAEIIRAQWQLYF